MVFMSPSIDVQPDKTYSFTDTASVPITRLVLIVAPTMNWPSSVNRRYAAPASSRPPVMYRPVRLFGFGGAVVLAVA